MRRLRVVFVLLFLGLLIPGVLLVRRALDSVWVERAVRHRTVAERIFDEMERSLSHFLRAEEERPYGHYRHAWSPPGSPTGVLFRSPLADPSPEPFLVGHFEVDLAGRVHTPLRPRPSEAPSGWPPPNPAAEAAAERVLELAERAWPSAPEPLETVQKPGTTVAVGFAARQDAEFHEEEKGALDDAYDALVSLNRGAELRSKRSQKIVKLEPQAFAEKDGPASSSDFGGAILGAASAPEPPPAREGSPKAASEVAAVPAPTAGSRRMSAAPRPPGAVDPRLFERIEAAISGEGAPEGRLRQEREASAATPAEKARRRAPQVTVDPMLGFALGEGHLVLHRTVWHGQQALRQGLILEVEALEKILLEAALPAKTFPGALARVRFAETPGVAQQPGRYHYRHRFAEPFDALAVDLEMLPLSEASGARTIYALSLALVLVGSLGLLALYRMVGVVVGFSERRSNFVAAVSHELKTPLTAIRMYAEMLRDGIVSGDEKRQEYYGTITAESERLSRLIDNVLEFSKLEKGTREMSWGVGDLGGLVREAISVLEPHAAAQGFDLTAEVEPDLPPVRFDRDAVLQVLFNLVDNALKYAREAREKTIRITCRRDGQRVVLAVRDHGPGVPSEHIGQIFEPFYRGEHELTRRAQGTGIGLSLVKGLAEQMDAVLRADNPPDGGFEIALAFPPC